MEKIRIAQIGTSSRSHGNEIWARLLKHSGLFEVVGYAMPEHEKETIPEWIKAFTCRPEMTVDEILADPAIEAVAVETEEVYLTEYALRAAKAGKHVYMEKPGGTDLARFEELVRTVKEKNLAFSIGYMYRYNPMVREIHEKIARGDLGEIYSVEAHMDCHHPVENRRWLKKFPGGMMFFLGCHLIDLIYGIQGEPEEVIPLNMPTGIDGVESDDYGMAILKYPNGVSFAKTSAAETGGFLRRQLVVCGSKGTIELKPIEMLVPGGQITVMNEKYEQANWHKPGTITTSAVYDRYDDMVKNFAEVVRGKKNPYSYDYELGLRRLLARCCGERK